MTSDLLVSNLYWMVGFKILVFFALLNEESLKSSLFFSKVSGLKPEIEKWANSHIFFKSFTQVLSICWGCFSWRHTMSPFLTSFLHRLFKRLFYIYMTSAYRRRIDVETTSCVYKVRNPRTSIYQNTSQCLLWYVHSLHLFIL